MISLFYAAIMLLSMFLGGVLASGIFCLMERKRAGISWTDGSRSRCDSCGRVLSPIELIPVLSYVFLKGRCRTCKAEIPPNGCRVELAWSLLAGLLSAICIEEYQHVLMCIVAAIAAICIAIIFLFCNFPKNDGKETRK